VEVVEQGLQRFRTSWEEFLDLRVEGKAEWVDGEVLVSPPAAPRHGEVASRLNFALMTALPSLVVYAEVGLRLPGNRLRIPDLMVVERRAAGRFVEEPPLVVAEILSRSTMTEDLLRKGPEYAAAGAHQYWAVDPEARNLLVFENADSRWEPLSRLDEQHPTGEVAVGEHGVVPLDLTWLLPT
jgi:Uma2 family endonuclease